MEDEDEEEGSGDEDDPFDNKEGGDEYILLLHSYNNDRATHMMGKKTVSIESCMRYIIPYSFSIMGSKDSAHYWNEKLAKHFIVEKHGNS